MSGCTCTDRCERYGWHGEHLVMLCKTRPDYRMLWGQWEKEKAERALPVLRTDAEIATIAAICQANTCGKWRPDDSCKLCGCPSEGPERLASKRRVGSCPLALW